ncbi:MAG: hypothetical protein GF311_14825 [Candidatus Lokiarchaeota archaeon]|nr:hypothetical protein [Candidatus Lokiarchaeota archaeon]
MNSRENAKNKYIFIGNFKKEFADTKYIKNKDFYTDIDICRHFGTEKIFFYPLHGFLDHYSWEEVWELAKHVQSEQPFYLKYEIYKSLTFLAFYCGLIIIDLFVSFPQD